jgi:hypothetical protein
VNKFFRRFKVNCYTIVLSNGEACDKDCLVYQTFFIFVKKEIFFCVIDIIVNYKSMKILVRSSTLARDMT